MPRDAFGMRTQDKQDKTVNADKRAIVWAFRPKEPKAQG